MILKKKSGEKVVWMYHNMLETDEEGKPYVVSTALNITEKVLMEKELLQKRNLELQKMMQHFQTKEKVILRIINKSTQLKIVSLYWFQFRNQLDDTRGNVSGY